MGTFENTLKAQIALAYGYTPEELRDPEYEAARQEYDEERELLRARYESQLQDTMSMLNSYDWPEGLSWGLDG